MIQTATPSHFASKKLMINKAIQFLEWSAPWRREFGTVSGIRAALALRRAIWAAPPNQRIKISVPSLKHGVEIRAGSSDVGVFVQVFGDHQADFPVQGNPAVIVDAGANIGLTAAVFASRFPSARVIALEIDKTNFALLQHNTRAYPNVEPMLKGLWSRKALLSIANPSAESWAFTATEANGLEPASIEALGIVDLMSELRLDKIDVLKIDIEGGEYEVFEGGVDGWIHHVGMIAVEVHDRFRPGCTEAIRRALAPHGFEESVWSEYLVYTRRSEAAP